jgi:phi13 family phage major tail protein
MKVGFPGGLYRAPNTADDVSVSPVYGAMVKMAGVKSAKVTFKADDQTVYAEDLTQEVVRYISSAEVEFNANELSLADRALLLGHTIAGGLVKIGANDTPPWTGLAFKLERKEGGTTHTQYIRLLKCYLQMPDDEGESKQDKMNPKGYTLKFVCVPRKYDNLVVEMTDTSFATYNPADGTGWFSAFGPADSTPPTISSSVPTTNATGVAVGSSYAWTFSEAVAPGCVTAANFFLIKDSDNSIVACNAPTLSGDKLTVTLTPSGNLTALAVYFAVCTKNVTDLAGNALAANAARKFTCA